MDRILKLVQLVGIEPFEISNPDHLKERSSKWPTVRKKFIELHNKCEVCWTLKNLDIHHIQPFHLKPELELDERNLITLCRDHHFEWGHFFNWKWFNPAVVMDIREFRLKLEACSCRAA